MRLPGELGDAVDDGGKAGHREDDRHPMQPRASTETDGARETGESDADLDRVRHDIAHARKRPTRRVRALDA